jgi:hypothetical protein
MDNEESILDLSEDGTKRWINKDGELHRLYGPAIEYSSGTKFWYQNGKLHRIGGPAIEYTGGGKFWYIRDKFYLNKEDFFNALTDEEKEIALFSGDFHSSW